MKFTVEYLLPGLAAAAIGAAVVFAPVAGATSLAASHTSVATPLAVGSAGTDPLVPHGTEPHVSTRLGYVDSNHDEANTTNGEVDLPF